MNKMTPKQIDPLAQHLTNVIHATVPYIILAKFAHWSIILVSLLLLLSLFVTLPFSPLWGWVLVPIGGAIACYFERKSNVIIRRAD